MSLGKVWWSILVANVATNFQDLVAKMKNLVALAPVLGAISRPEMANWFASGQLGFLPCYVKRFELLVYLFHCP